MDGQMTENVLHRLDKISIDKIRLEENSIDKKIIKFIKPTIEEIQEYCLERNNSINAESFYNYYETSNWFRGKNKIKDWKACIRTWESNSNSKNTKQEEGFVEMMARRSQEMNLNEVIENE